MSCEVPTSLSGRDEQYLESLDAFLIRIDGAIGRSPSLIVKGSYQQAKDTWLGCTILFKWARSHVMRCITCRVLPLVRDVAAVSWPQLCSLPHTHVYVQLMLRLQKKNSDLTQDCNAGQRQPGKAGRIAAPHGPPRLHNAVDPRRYVHALVVVGGLHHQQEGGQQRYQQHPACIPSRIASHS